MPVGAIYLSVDGTNPATLFGGTWEQIKDKFILCSGDTYSNGSAGGSATINLNHQHSISRGKACATIGNYSERINFQSSSFKWSDLSGDQYTWSHNADEKLNSSHSHYADGCFVNVLGDTDSTSLSAINLPPYIAVTVWKRVS